MSEILKVKFIRISPVSYRILINGEYKANLHLIKEYSKLIYYIDNNKTRDEYITLNLTVILHPAPGDYSLFSTPFGDCPFWNTNNFEEHKNFLNYCFERILTKLIT